MMEFTAYNATDPSIAVEQFLKGEKQFFISNPNTFNKTALLLHKLIKETHIDFILIDSLKALQTTYLEDNIKDGIEQLPMGINARSLENFLPFLKNNILAPNEILGIIINQVRTKFASFGGYDDEPDQHAYRFYPDLRFMVKNVKDGDIKVKIINNEGEKVDKKVGNWVEIVITKGRGNKFSYLRVPVVFGRGISTIFIYRNILEREKLIVSPSWYEGKVDLNVLREALDSSGIDVSVIPVSVTGESGLNDFIKNNIPVIEEYIIKNNLMFVEKQV
jgi:hypothetical protein